MKPRLFWVAVFFRDFRNLKKRRDRVEKSKIKQEVWKTIQALNRAWAIEGNPDKLKDYFHKDMVAITPTDHNCVEGRDACVAGWKKFVETAKIHYWKENDPKIQIYGNGKFAVVTYYWDISYEMGGQTIKTAGRDMFALVKEKGKWWVVADQFSTFPNQ